ncbi:hypothetical protein ACERJO_08780 [Halalkalibacter sp. AB-rgal2]|uniref:hypothetical protein n=1 Tax=Halalkalibacter sp. AB-rgal2 TaxID=3242695 RepID=UPI00359DCDDE
MYSSAMVFKRIVSLVAIPILSVLSIGLSMCSIIVVVGGILYTIGVDIRMEFWPDVSVPPYLGVPTGFLFGALLLAIAFLSWRLLKYLIAFWKI